MANMGRFDMRELRKFQEKVNQLQNPDAFVESCKGTGSKTIENGRETDTCWKLS